MTNPIAVAVPTGPWATFGIEMLDHLRLGYELVDMAAPDALPEQGILLLLEPPERAAAARLAAWVRAGGALVCVGGAGPLAELAGVVEGAPVPEGHVRLTDVRPRQDRVDVELHAFGGRRLTALDRSVGVLARWSDHSAAAVRRAVGQGLLLVVGVDVWQSIGRIQQGWPVEEPGRPAPDGSAAVGADGILRCDDGLALSYTADRAMPDGSAAQGRYEASAPPDGPVPVFHRPMADLWREVVLHLLLDAAESARVPLAWLHYWPAGVPAVGHISHDSDLNVDEHARLGLQVFDDAGVRVSWCHCWPGGYSDEVVAAIGAAGHEHALHYNALDVADGTPWGAAELRKQHAWATAMTGTDIVTNKNHYTRWEGWTEFYDWCAEVGIQIEQSHGPSKPGTVGFPYGSCHVGFPVTPDGQRYDVLALPFHTQDVGWQSDESVIDLILDQALDQHGVAHFLFHGANMPRTPRVPAAVRAVADGGRERGMPWWTAGEINAFERARRGVDVRVEAAGDGALCVRVEARQPIDGAGLVITGGPQHGWRAEQVGAGPVPIAQVRRHGRDVLELTVDIPAGTTEIMLTAEDQS